MLGRLRIHTSFAALGQALALHASRRLVIFLVLLVIIIVAFILLVIIAEVIAQIHIIVVFFILVHESTRRRALCAHRGWLATQHSWRIILVIVIVLLLVVVFVIVEVVVKSRRLGTGLCSAGLHRLNRRRRRSSSSSSRWFLGGLCADDVTQLLVGQLSGAASSSRSFLLLLLIVLVLSLKLVFVLVLVLIGQQILRAEHATILVLVFTVVSSQEHRMSARVAEFHLQERQQTADSTVLNESTGVWSGVVWCVHACRRGLQTSNSVQPTACWPHLGSVGEGEAFADRELVAGALVERVARRGVRLENCECMAHTQSSPCDVANPTCLCQAAQRVFCAGLVSDEHRDALAVLGLGTQRNLGGQTRRGRGQNQPPGRKSTSAAAVQRPELSAPSASVHGVTQPVAQLACDSGPHLSWGARRAVRRRDTPGRR